MTVEPIAWDGDRLRLLDQTRLPVEEVWLELTNHHEVAEAISSVRVRGAPAIGVAGAYGIALAALSSAGSDLDGLIAELRSAADQLIATRPTGANLSWAVKRTLAAAQAAAGLEEARRAALNEALRIQREDIEGNRALGQHGLALVPEHATVLTHCNAGALATGGYGTALGIVLTSSQFILYTSIDHPCETSAYATGMPHENGYGRFASDGRQRLSRSRDALRALLQSPPNHTCAWSIAARGVD